MTVDGLVAAAEARANGDSRSSPANSSVAESLRQLKALHDEGILTDDEYETKRKPLADELLSVRRMRTGTVNESLTPNQQ